MVDQIQKIVDR